MATAAGGGGGGYVPPVTGPVTPEEIYQLLLNQGFSTVQAIGIMANSINESSLGPEAVGDGGTSFGFVQFHEPGYAGASSLVTGNPQADIRAQIKYLAQVVSPAAVAGSTPQQVAGNFAAHFEECVGCQPGETQYNSRVGNVGGLSAAVSSGNWQTVTSSSIGGGAGSSSSSAAGGSACLIQFPGIAGLGATCLFSKSQARALIGGLMLVPAAGSLAVGVVLLAAFAFRRSGAGGAVGQAAEATGAAVAFIPGGEAAGAAIAAAGSAEKRAARQRTQQQGQERAARQTQARERREGRQYDEVMSRRRDSAAGPAVRDEPPF